MTLSDQGKPAGIGHNSQQDPEIEKIVQALERDGFETRKPRGIPYEELQKLARRALKSEEGRDDLADAVQGDLYSALTGAIDVPTGADLAGAAWLREATGPTALLALARYARMGGDVTGAFLLYVILRCVREALVVGGAAEFRASDAEIAAAFGVTSEQIRRARQRIQQDGGAPLLTIETAERSKPRYVLASIPAAAVAHPGHITHVLDRLEAAGHLIAPDKPPRAWGGPKQSAARHAADLEPAPVDNSKSAARYAADAAARYAADGNAPATNSANLRRGTPQIDPSAARYAADAVPLKGDQKSRARPASCSNISGKEFVSTEDALDKAEPHTVDRASGKEEHASRGTAIAVHDQHEKIIEGEILVPAAAQPTSQLVPSPSGSLLPSGEEDTPVTMNEARRSIRARYPSGKIITIGWSIISAAAREAGVAEDVALFNAALFVNGWVTPEDWRTTRDGCFHPNSQILPALVREFRKAKGSLIKSASELQQTETAARTSALALPGPGGVRWRFQPDDKPNTPFGRVTVSDANRILDMADEMHGRQFVNVDDFDNVGMQADDEFRSVKGWKDNLAVQVLWSALSDRAFHAPSDKLVAELAALAPDLPASWVKGFILAAFADPAHVGLSWIEYDKEATPCEIKARLSKGLPLVQAEWLAECRRLEEQAIGIERPADKWKPGGYFNGQASIIEHACDYLKGFGIYEHEAKRRLGFSEPLPIYISRKIRALPHASREEKLAAARTVVAEIAEAFEKTGAQFFSPYFIEPYARPAWAFESIDGAGVYAPWFTAARERHDAEVFHPAKSSPEKRSKSEIAPLGSLGNDYGEPPDEV